jgi:hypothetical protein
MENMKELCGPKNSARELLEKYPVKELCADRKLKVVNYSNIERICGP